MAAQMFAFNMFLMEEHRRFGNFLSSSSLSSSCLLPVYYLNSFSFFCFIFLSLPPFSVSNVSLFPPQLSILPPLSSSPPPLLLHCDRCLILPVVRPAGGCLSRGDEECHAFSVDTHKHTDTHSYPSKNSSNKIKGSHVLCSYVKFHCVLHYIYANKDGWGKVDKKIQLTISHSLSQFSEETGNRFKGRTPRQSRFRSVVLRERVEDGDSKYLSFPTFTDCFAKDKNSFSFTSMLIYMLIKACYHHNQQTVKSKEKPE